LSSCFVDIGTTQLSTGVVCDEAVDRSLSTDRFNTSDLDTLGLGSNDMLAATVSGISKFFTFTIGEGTELSSMIVEEWMSVVHLCFHGVIEGDDFSIDSSSPDVTPLLEFVHHGPVHVDEAPLMELGPVFQGFTAPSDWVPVPSHCDRVVANLRFRISTSR
jgi:hypothetical protein